MSGPPPLDPERILAVLDSVHDQESSPPGEGLRERKKRQLRQRISNVATALFLAEGFEAVSVARIAARADVSEQTVFNHFPTKESMLFDRAGGTSTAIADSVRDPSRPLSAIVQPRLLGQMWPYRWQGIDEQDGLALLRRFAEVADASATLQVTPYLAMAPFMDAVTTALAQRSGTDPDDPGVQLVATMLAGLLLLRRRSFQAHVVRATSLDTLGRAVEADIQRAIDLARPTFDAFDARPQGRRAVQAPRRGRPSSRPRPSDRR